MEQASVHFTPDDVKMVEENLRNALIPPPSSVLVIGPEDYAGGDQLFPPLSLRSRLADFVKRGPTVKLLGKSLKVSLITLPTCPVNSIFTNRYNVFISD